MLLLDVHRQWEGKMDEMKGRWMKSGLSKADWSPQQAMQPPEDALKPMSVLIDSDLKWCGHPAEARAPVTELNTHTPYLEVRGA